MKKKLLFILLPVLILGGVAGAGLMGFIQIPGLSPKKKAIVSKQDPAAQPEQPKSKPSHANADLKSATPDPIQIETPKTDSGKGAKKLARLWNAIEPDKLLPMTAKWKDAELAEVLSFMEVEKAASLLALMDPQRASKLSMAIESLASVVPQNH